MPPAADPARGSDRLVADWCRRHTTAEVCDQFNAIGLAITRVNTCAEASHAEQIRARDMLQKTRLSDGEVP